jgi:hypothetical protein
MSGNPGNDRILNPSEIRIARDPFGGLTLFRAGQESASGLKPVRAFPLTAPDRYISLVDRENREVGVIRDLHELDSSSKRVLQEELELAYLMPKILQIRSVVSVHGMTTWELETDRGPRTIYVRERTDIRRLRGRRVVMTDTTGMKYEIPDWRALDLRSQELLEQEM